MMDNPDRQFTDIPKLSRSTEHFKMDCKVANRLSDVNDKSMRMQNNNASVFRPLHGQAHFTETEMAIFAENAANK